MLITPIRKLAFSSLLACAIMSVCHTSHASTLDGKKLDLSGFGTLGAVTTTSDTLGFRKDLGHIDGTFEGEIDFKALSALGFQAQYTITDKLSFIGQLLFEDTVKNNIDDRINIASLNYDVNDNWLLRVGRIPHRGYTLSDYRRIGYAYDWTHPVYEFYNTLITNHLNGFDLTYTTTVNEGFLRINGSFGRFDIDIEVESAESIVLRVDQAFGLNVEYEYKQWRFRISHLAAQVKEDWEGIPELRGAVQGFSAGIQANPLLPEGLRNDIANQGFSLADEISIAGDKFGYSSIGLSFNYKNWHLEAETALLESESSTINDYKSSYISLSRYINNFTPYILLSTGDTKSGPQIPEGFRLIQSQSPIEQQLAIEALIQGVDQLFNETFRLDSLTLGLRYNLSAFSTVKAQWDRKFVDENGGELFIRSPEYTGAKEIFDVFSLTYSFIF